MCTGGDVLTGGWNAEIHVVTSDPNELIQVEKDLQNAIWEAGVRDVKVEGITDNPDQGRRWSAGVEGAGKDIVSAIQALRNSIERGTISVHATWEFSPSDK
ncbi:hypothetical protein [Streptomyces sp. IMTB 2501]|uniref:hypothetical protein n=1 Tax=Streptomyces sp. IMTB 2501 TaxID=1776340 RepID=UPI00117D65A5|nr:hypothetical protein [Streptomyces sp. IMTB 2501]